MTVEGKGEDHDWMAMVRHLVLPERLADTREVVSFIARELSPDTYLNIMDSYRPCFEAAEFPPSNRRIAREEFREAVAMAREEGLWRLDGL
jgi:putative pyruvate formate lyase activating enzyme